MPKQTLSRAYFYVLVPVLRKENIEDYKPGIRRRKCKNVNLFKPAQGDFFLDSNEKVSSKMIGRKARSYVNIETT